MRQIERYVSFTMYIQIDLDSILTPGTFESGEEGGGGGGWGDLTVFSIVIIV